MTHAALQYLLAHIDPRVLVNFRMVFRHPPPVNPFATCSADVCFAFPHTLAFFKAIASRLWRLSGSPPDWGFFWPQDFDEASQSPFHLPSTRARSTIRCLRYQGGLYIPGREAVDPPCTSTSMISVLYHLRNQEQSYLLSTSEAALGIGIIHVLTSKHLSWLAVLTRILLAITTHVRAWIHGRWTAAILLIGRSHAAMLQLSIVRSAHLRLSLRSLLGLRLLVRLLSAGSGGPLGLTAGLLSRDDVDKEIKHI